MGENPQLPAYIRTYIPMLVVILGRELSKHGLNIDNELLNVVVGVLVGALYYAVIRLAEGHRAWFGWFLGAYAPGPAPKPDTGQDVTAQVEPDFDEDTAGEFLQGDAAPEVGD